MKFKIYYFGFYYKDWSENSRILFLNKPIKKQLDNHSKNYVLNFSVILFIDNPQLIKNLNIRFVILIYFYCLDAYIIYN